MKLKSLYLPDLLVIEPRIYEDHRGMFFEFYHETNFSRAGIPHHFMQDNYSFSHRGVLRGLHYQIRKPQGKLVRVMSGEIFDVAVDLRRSSPTFGQWAGLVLSSQNRLQLWIPPGYAHGFYVLGDSAELIYKVTDEYTPDWERTILWNDPTLNIAWPLKNNELPILSEKDKYGQRFLSAELFD